MMPVDNFYINVSIINITNNSRLFVISHLEISRGLEFKEIINKVVTVEKNINFSTGAHVPTLQYGHYLTHLYSNITLAVAAMES